MSGPDKNETAETVPCEVCMKEVPVSDAQIEETDDYVRHFCGLDCYKKWRGQAESKQDK